MTTTMAAPTPRAWDALTDEEVVRRVLAGEGALFEVLMRRYNQRLYRVARAILRDEGEAEDVMQQAYVNAYAHLGQFEQRSRGLSEDNVKTRLSRSRAMLRRELFERAGVAAPDVFSFHLSRCDRVVAAVLDRLGVSTAAAPPLPAAGTPPARG